MAEEEEESLNIKRSWERAKVKHSTPAEVSPLSQNALGVSPIPQKTPRSAHFFEGQPPQSRVQSSLHLLQRSLSVVSDRSQELHSGSRFTFPTRRLSTITDSEESPETLPQTVPEESDWETRNLRRSQRKSQKVKMEQEPKGPERPASRRSTVKSKTERNLQKQLVERRVRAWELRQLINIEEAVTHELIVDKA
ncbi:coiled-coil domain-containing protein 201 [Heteronotia binoei]|uniref:coiled-coil domain-containing protein 201 n=1 Tax=Heteronotia binoei TaxID=13085 RepID=UPI00292CF231|nr:coiled-coil domain-containing protein 201 [Heteronotia binoei]XP_060104250.1 coiled-coil domain-containing protein 201 [Heteronotia binoei]